jgi:hypothetical protein
MSARSSFIFALLPLLALPLGGCASSAGGASSESASDLATEASPAAGGESGCHTDGCVMRRQAEFQAVLQWIDANDECSSVVAWPQSVVAKADSRFVVTCGDTSDRSAFTVRVDNPSSSTDPSKIAVVQVGAPQRGAADGESGCHTDGCVILKSTAFAAVEKWLAANDDCASVVAWPQAIRKTGDASFSVVCGDVEPTTIALAVENPNLSTNPDDLVVTVRR